MTSKTTITKFEAARRQLVTAIRLFFEGADSVSVYALAHASWEVLDALCKHRNLLRFRNEMSGATGRSEQEIKQIANYGRNFFKHANTDPDDVLEDFSDDLNDHVLMGATMDFGTLASSKPMEVQVFQLWYFAAYPEKASIPGMATVLEAAQSQFPNMAALNREQKKRAGRQLLVAALRDAELMSHPSTDRAKVSSLP